MERDETPGSARIDDILFTEFENDENTLVNDVLIDEKLGFIKLESDERPGPEKIDGYTVDIAC